MKTIFPVKLHREEGSSLVEFALVAFLLIMVLLSVVEMSRFILVYTTMADAARAGVRYAMVHGGDLTSGASTPDTGKTTCSTGCSGITTVVQNYANAGLIGGASVNTTVTYPDSTNVAGARVQVAVQWTYVPLVAYFVPSLTQTLSSTSEGVIVF